MVTVWDREIPGAIAGSFIKIHGGPWSSVSSFYEWKISQEKDLGIPLSTDTLEAKNGHNLRLEPPCQESGSLRFGTGKSTQ